ncbi:MAG: hypothetical protein OIF58_00475, partial [Cohaesibacter sp.]|nr:hypothetical protein [Cohaesibacter sp.]
KTSQAGLAKGTKTSVCLNETYGGFPPKMLGFPRKTKGFSEPKHVQHLGCEMGIHKLAFANSLVHHIRATTTVCIQLSIN